MPRVAGFSPDDLLVQAGLARLMGLGLGFLPREKLLSCSLPEVSQSLALPPIPSRQFPVATGSDFWPAKATIDSQEETSALQMEPLDVEIKGFSPAGGTNEDREVSLVKDEGVKVEEVSEVKEVVAG